MTSSSRPASLSLLFALLTLISFCVGAAPIPLTALVCYPAALLTGVLALFNGFQALAASPEQPQRTFALIGIWTGVLVILAVLCASTLSILLINGGLEYLQNLWQAQ
jgi:hypothetical protein